MTDTEKELNSWGINTQQELVDTIDRYLEEGIYPTILELILKSYREALTTHTGELQKVVKEQANDEALWCDPVYASEAYIQKALRRLHEVIEGKTSEECAIDALGESS